MRTQHTCLTPAAESRVAMMREQLEAISRSARDEMRDELAREPPSDPVALYTDIERRFSANIQSFERWEAQTIGSASVAALRDTAVASWRCAVLNAVSDDDVRWNPDTRRDAFATCIAERDVEAALAAFVTMEDRYRRVHDAHRDWLSWLWSAVYREGGVDALDRLFRTLADSSLMRWMERDVTLPPDDRVGEWARVMTANFAEIEVAEHDDYFEIVQSPCGTCGRQVAAARYDDAALQLVSVAGVPIYRTHLAVMHDALPRERIGVPWPAIACPRSTGGACHVYLMKDPLDPRDPRTTNWKDCT